LRAAKGGAIVVGVAVERGEPRVVLSTFLATGTEGDRLSLEPYRVANEMKRDAQGRVSAEAVNAVAEGRRRQDRLAAQGLNGITRALAEAKRKPVVGALLVNRAGWVTDLLEYSASWREHVPVAEGLAVREALRFALRECRIESIELDEKSLPALASSTLELSTIVIDERIKTTPGLSGVRPWRKEQKLACLAAWVAVTAQRGCPA